MSKSVELFKVTCVTCQATLSVRNAALIGQIVACPRCGSMVEIARPAIPTAGPAAAAAVLGATVPSSTPAHAPETHERCAAEDVAQSAGTFDDAALANALAEPAANAPAPPAETEAAAEPPDGGAALADGGGYASMIAWSAGSFLVGAAITGLFLAFRSGTQPASPSAAEQHASAEHADDSLIPSASADEVSSAAELPTGDAPEAHAPLRESTDTSREPAHRTTDRASPEPTQSAQLPELPDATEIAGAEDAVPQNESPAGENVAPSSATAESPSNATQRVREERTLIVEPVEEDAGPEPFDPLELDPEQLALADLARPPATPSTNAALESSEPAEHAEVPAHDEREDDGSLVVELAADQDGSYRTRSASEQLERVVPSFEVDAMPLFEFLHLISGLAGVPVSVAPDQLAMAGITAGKRVSLEVEEVTLADALEQALLPLRLQAVADGPQVRLRRRDAGKVRTIDYPVDDLVTQGVTEQDFEQWVRRLIAPSTWDTEGGAGVLKSSPATLTAIQPQHVQYELLIFLERIRLARDTPLRSRYPQSLLTKGPMVAAVSERMSAPTVFTFSHDTRFDAVVRHWQRELGLPVLVDWPALATVDLWPQTRLRSAIADQPWQQALDSVLEPLGLGWRAVSGGAIQITSLDAVAGELQLDLYPLRAGETDALETDNRDRLLERLESFSSGSEAAIVLDPGNQMLYCLQPAAVQRQIYQWLTDQALLATGE